MEGGFYSDWNDNSSSIFGSENLEEELEQGIARTEEIFARIPQPETPREPMKFLSRSWSLSTSEVSKALAQKQQRQQHQDLSPTSQNSPSVFFQDAATDPLITSAGKIMNSAGTHKSGRLSKWFHHKQHTNPSTMRNPKKKDKARVEKARVHSAVSIAALAAGLASVTFEESCSKGSGSTMGTALASATELLASHCIDMAEQAGADHACVASTVRSSVDIHTPGDLMTLTAAAATALRGEAALKARQPKEARKNASITPFERSFSDTNWPENSQFRLEDQNCPLEGELVQSARNGVQRMKRVCVYINNKSQVMIKLKSKQVGGAFSKKIKCLVYGICDEKENSEEVCFGLKTGQGLLEFKCKSKIQKQRWVSGIQTILRQVTCLETAKCSLEPMSLSDRMR